MPVLTDNPDRVEPIVMQPSGLPTESMYVWMLLVTQLAQIVQRGFSGTIVTAALTGGGTQGSMTFQNGVLISQVAAT